MCQGPTNLTHFEFNKAFKRPARSRHEGNPPVLPAGAAGPPATLSFFAALRSPTVSRPQKRKRLDELCEGCESPRTPSSRRAEASGECATFADALARFTDLSSLARTGRTTSAFAGARRSEDAGESPAAGWTLIAESNAGGRIAAAQLAPQDAGCLAVDSPTTASEASSFEDTPFADELFGAPWCADADYPPPSADDLLLPPAVSGAAWELFPPTCATAHATSSSASSSLPAASEPPSAPATPTPRAAPTPRPSLRLAAPLESFAAFMPARSRWGNAQKRAAGADGTIAAVLHRITAQKGTQKRAGGRAEERSKGSARDSRCVATVAAVQSRGVGWGQVGGVMRGAGGEGGAGWAGGAGEWREECEDGATAMWVERGGERCSSEGCEPFDESQDALALDSRFAQHFASPAPDAAEVADVSGDADDVVEGADVAEGADVDTWLAFPRESECEELGSWCATGGECGFSPFADCSALDAGV